MLHAVNTQHGLQRIGPSAIARLGIKRLDDSGHILPWQNLLHAGEENLFSGLTALSAEFTIGEGELMAHDVPLGCAPDEYDDLISGTCSHLPFINLMRDCHSSDDKDVIAIDGKTLRHSYDKSRRKGAIHVISAFSTMHSLVIGQIKTDEKSNEITAIPELLNMLDIKGKIITTDAMGCQKDIAEKIQKQGGDYLFAVKGNQGRLNKAFEEKFPLKELNNPEHDSYAMSEKSHGREEIRLHIVCDVPDELIDFTFEWKGLKKLCVAVSFRSIIAEQKKEPEMTVRYYISSADLTAEKFATAIRNHWHVENKLHWRLDVVMNEDDCKIRRGNAAELFSGIRHIAINILTNDKVFKAGLRRKMRKAAMDRNYLASVFAGSGLS